MKIKRLLTATTLACLSLLGLASIVKLSQAYSAQKQALGQTPTLLSEAEAGNKVTNLDSLKTLQKTIQDTISTLEGIPQLPGFDYGQAQAELGKLRPIASRIGARIQVEEQAAANLEAARKLDAEAASLVQKPPYPVEVWQQAKEKWQQAISILEKIPDNTFVSAVAKDGLASSRINYGVVGQNLTAENKAIAQIEAALEAAETATALTQDQPHKLVSLMNARSQWVRAVTALNDVASTTTIASDAKGLLPIYVRNFHSVNNAVEQYQQCLRGKTYFSDLCGYDIALDIETPKPEVADSEIDESTEEVAEVPDTDPTYIASVGLSRYRRYKLSSSGSTHVRGYTRSDGTYVRGHTRSTSGSRASGFGHSRSGGASS